MKKESKVIKIIILVSIFSALSNNISITQASPTVSNPLTFSNNTQLDDYFSGQIGDGQSPQTAYMIEDLEFQDTINPEDVLPYDVDYNVQIHISNTDRFINITNCVFQRYEDGMSLELSATAILLQNCKNVVIENCIFECRRVLRLENCNNTLIYSSIFSDGTIDIRNANYTVVSSNIFQPDTSKIHTMFDYYTTKSNGNIYCLGTYNTTIFNNTLIDSMGISVGAINNIKTTIKNNTLIRSQFDIKPSEVEIPAIDTSNTVNGRYYYAFYNKQDLIEKNFTNAGQIYLYNCKNCSISGVYCEYLQDGIMLESCDNITLFNSTVIYPVYSGVHLRASSNITLYNNSIFGWTYDWQKYADKMGNQNPLAVEGIMIRGNTEVTPANNINVTQNVVCGYQCGIFIFTQYLDNVTVWDNYYAFNAVNGYIPAPKERIIFNNASVGNYWDDYQHPRIDESGVIPSASQSVSNTLLPTASVDTWDGIYNANGIVDYRPLKTYDHAVVLFDLVALYPWDSDSLNIWVIIGIVAGAAGIASTIVIKFIKKRNLN